MKKMLLSKIRLLFVLFCSAFLLNFLWEAIHGAFLYEGLEKMISVEYVPLILYAATVDSVLIVFMWGLSTLALKDVNLFKTKLAFSWVLFISLGLLFAIFIEVRAVFFENRWEYSSLMPTIFGIGISPLIQLVITGILAIKIANLFDVKELDANRTF